MKQNFDIFLKNPDLFFFVKQDMLTDVEHTEKTVLYLEQKNRNIRIRRDAWGKKRIHINIADKSMEQIHKLVIRFNQPHVGDWKPD